MENFFRALLWQICQVRFIEPDHVQLTLLNWDNKTVLALNKNLKFPILFQFFYLVPKHFLCPNLVKSIAHDPAPRFAL